MEGAYFPCVNAADCPYRVRPQGCHEIRAHKYYPSRVYKTILERAFRDLPENVEIRCRRFEEESHAIEPVPDKPDRDLMREAVIAAHQAGDIYLSSTKMRAIYGE